MIGGVGATLLVWRMRSSWGAEMSWPGLRLCWRAWRLPVRRGPADGGGVGIPAKTREIRPSREWCWCTGWVAAARAGCCGSSRAWQRDRSRAHLASAGQVGTVWLDWEDKQRDDPASYAGAAGPSLVTVLDAVQQAVLAAVRDSRAEQAFGDYRQGAARMPEYAARFADVVAQSRQAGSPFTATDAAVLGKAAASAGMLAIGHPGGLLGLTPDQLAAVGQAGGHLSEAAARAVTGKKPGEISQQEYDLVTDPSRELTRRAATAIRTVAGHRPPVVFLDTGEIIGDPAWRWLRRLMSQTGPRVAWVVGARFETEAEAGADSPVAKFVREIGDEFLVRISPARFDDEMIREYLQVRPNAPSYTNEQIDMVARFTRGLPLAVSFTATLLDEGQPLEEVCRVMGDGHPSTVVSQLARRYLVHAERQDYLVDDPRRDDVHKDSWPGPCLWGSA